MLRAFRAIARVSALSHKTLPDTAKLMRFSASRLQTASRASSSCFLRPSCQIIVSRTAAGLPLQGGLRHASSSSSAGASASSTPHAEGNESNSNADAKSSQDETHQQHDSSASSRASFFSAYRNYRQARSARQGRQYQTLSMYLDRLPPGLRELLLYSPLLALFYFVFVQARDYYLDEGEPWYYVVLPARWRYAPAAPAPLHPSSSSSPLLAPAKNEKGGGSANSQQPPAIGLTASTEHVSSLLKHAPTHPSEAVNKVEHFSFAATLDKHATRKPLNYHFDHPRVHIDVTTRDEKETGAVAESDAASPAANTSATSTAAAGATMVLQVATTCRYAAMDTRDVATTLVNASAGTNASDARTQPAMLAKPPLIAPFHETTVRFTETEDLFADKDGVTFSNTPEAMRQQVEMKAKGKNGRGEKAVQAAAYEAAEALSRRYPYGVWDGPLEVLRDPATSKIIGYTTASTQ